MKLVVTGGAGYIGSNVAALLVENGHEVIVLDNLSQGHVDAVPEGARFIEGNVTEFEAKLSGEQNLEAVIHLAAYIAAGESVKKPELYWENNTIGSLRLLTAMRNMSVKKLIFSSTAAVYGEPKEVPITEESTTRPTNPYGMSKLAVDMAIASECTAHGLAAASLRYFNVGGAYQGFGERHADETHIIPLALAAIDNQQTFAIFGDDYPTQDGTCIRDYIHVRDLARAHVLAMEKLSGGLHNVYNLGNGQGFSNRQVVAAVEKVTGKKLPIEIMPRRKGDTPILIASSAKAQKELGWTPQSPGLETIIKDSWDFYRQQ